MIKTSDFQPASLLGNRHLQTILPNAGFRRPRRSNLERETLELSDGDFLHLDWLAGGAKKHGAPLLMCLHGLEGSSQSNYAADLIGQAKRSGWDAVVMHFRGCSGTTNRLPRSYHAGETTDLAAVLDHIRLRQPEPRRLFVAGYSLGGNMLLKYLGEQGHKSPIDAAVAVSVPFDLYGAALSIDKGFGRLYQYALMRKMKERVRTKRSVLCGLIDVERALKSRNFVEFDEHVTAPLHGFSGHRDYYNRCSSIHFMKSIATPTLVLHARDDPFLDQCYLPTEAHISDSVTIEYSANGGHVGFVIQKKPWQPALWLPRRIMEYFSGRV
jgi:predicted alpha/beta-fold hydrolase